VLEHYFGYWSGSDTLGWYFTTKFIDSMAKFYECMLAMFVAAIANPVKYERFLLLEM